MQNTAWVAMLKRIPPEYHSRLMMVTTSGNEINLQVIYRMEDDYIVLRGRLAGTTEAGSLLFIPYDQINYVGFREELKEAQVQAMFSDSPAPAVAAPAQPEPPKPHPAEPTAVAPVAPPPAPSPTATPTTSPGKAALLERLRRSRAGQDSKHD
jgi:cell division septation protein DedD